MFRRNCVQFHNKKGFTLAELLVVLGITVILFSIGLVALLHYSNVLKLMEMDNTAKELFISAQNHLTQAETSGQLAKDVKDANIDKGTSFSTLSSKPSDMSQEDWISDQNDMYFITYSKGESSKLDNSILKDMLPFGAIDSDIRDDGYYIIEYNVKTATVYGVFYTDSKDNLQESDFLAAPGTDFDTATTNNVLYRRTTAKGGDARIKYDYQGNHVIGYYGGAMVELLSADIEKPTLKINNGNKLTVTITDPNYYTEVTNNNTNTQLRTNITLTVTGKESGNSKTFILNTTDTAGTPAPTDSTEKFWTVDKTEISTAKSGLVYKVNLDDITTQGGHFAELCDNMIPGEDIIVTASCASNSVLTPVVNSNEGFTNSLFADVKQDKNDNGTLKTTGTAEVANIRHLENLEPRISNIPASTTDALTFTTKDTSNITSETKNTSVKPAYVISSVQQTKNIYFNSASSSDTTAEKGFTDSVGTDFYVYGNTKNSDVTGDTTRYTKLAAQGSYYGIANSNINNYDGNNYSINDLVSDTSAINNKDGESNTNKYGDYDSGLFRIASADQLSFANMILKNFNCTSYKQSGALVGEIQYNTIGGKNPPSSVTIKNVAVIDGTIGTNITDGSNQSQGNVGGLIGFVSTDKLTVNDCSASATCTSETGCNVGGLIGRIQSPKMTITNCYSGGHTTKGEYSTDNYNVSANYVSGRYSGGLVGFDTGTGSSTYTNCYSTCSVYGMNAGGFVGQVNKTGEFVNCYCTGLVKGTNAGCFAQSIKTYSNKSSSMYYLDGINSSTTKAVQSGSSGIIAATTSTGIVDTNSTTTETNNFDSTLNGIQYPYRMVNKAGAKNTSSTAVHYGDWPNIQADATAENIFAYREGTSNSGYHWHTITAALSDSKEVTTSEYDNLVKDKDNYIGNDEPCYGILTPVSSGKKFPESRFNGNASESFDTDNAELVTVNGKQYYFWKVNTKKYNENVKTELPAWYFSSSKGKNSYYVYFVFNPGFAASMMEYYDNATNKQNSWTFGKSNNPYQVRTETQFTNIDNSSYLDKYFIQTSDIKMSTAYTAPVITGSFTGTYSAAYKTDENYEIKGLNEAISSGERSGLFFENQGTIKALTLSDSTINITSSDIHYAGAIAAYCGGTMTNCKSTVKANAVIKSPTSIMHFGNFVGYASRNSKFNGCESHGSFELTDTGKNSSSSNLVDIGGFVGRCDAYDNDGYAVVDCHTDASVSVTVTNNSDVPDSGSPCVVGGFAGYGVSSKINKCSSKSQISVTSSMSYVGGFIGGIDQINDYSDGSTINECWSKCNITNNGEKGWTCGFIGMAGEYQDDDGALVSNCYAATNFTNTTTSRVRLFSGLCQHDMKFTNDHAVEIATNNGTTSVIKSSKQFGEHDLYGWKLFWNLSYDSHSKYSNCYTYSTWASTNSSFNYNFVHYAYDLDGINYNTSSYNFTNLVDGTVWKSNIATVYPTLINNPEK